MADLPQDRLPALLCSAAIRLLLRRDDASEPLAAYFPRAGDPQPPFDERFAASFDEFCSNHLDDIVAVCAERRYQMSEVARSAQIAIGIASSIEANDRIALVDLGTGAGFALELDRYRYRIGDEFAGPRDALEIACEPRGKLRPPLPRLPDIVDRIGIDLAPVDLADPDARAWLEACTPPEESALARLAAAVEIVRREGPHVIGGDIVEALPTVLDDVLDGVTVVVVDAYTVVFLPDERRQSLTNVLAEAGRHRRVVWLSLDPLVPLGPSGSESVQGIDLADELVARYQREGVFAVLGARTFDASIDERRLLAAAHPSGAWIEWLGDDAADFG